MLPGHALMVGRDRELEALRQAFADVEHGASRAFVVSGEAGIGKSRLVREFLDGLGDRAVVLTGECVDSGSGPIPFAAAQGLLAGIRRLADRDPVFAAAGVGELAGEIASGQFDGAQDRWLAAVADLFASVAGVRPTVIVVEDLHWADGGTLDAVRFMLARNRDVPALTLLTYRSDDVGRRHALRPWLAELERARLADRLPLARLDEGDAARLAAELAGGEVPRAALATILERGDGVPFYIEEIVDALDGGEPGALGDLMLARYLSLSAPAQALLRVVAAGGGTVRHELLRDVAGIDNGALEVALREAIDANVLVVVDDEAYRFRHALMREAVGGELLPGERIRVHTAYAAALARRGRSVANLAAVADHAWMARDLDLAFAAALDVLRAGRSIPTGSTGSRMGERALELWDRVADPVAAAGAGRHEVLVLTARAIHVDGSPTRALELLREALAEWPADDPVGQARTLVVARGMLPEVGDAGGDELLERALALLGPAGHDDVRAEILIEISRAANLAGGGAAAAIEAATRAYEAATSAGSTSLASIAINLRGSARVHSGDAGGFEDLERARVLAGDDERVLVRYHLNASDAYIARGEVRTGLRIAEEGARIARNGWAGMSYFAASSANAIEALLWLGEWRRAEDWMAELDRVLEPSIHAAWIWMHRFALLLHQGRVEEAEAHHRANRSLFERQASVEVQSRGPYRTNLALLRHLEGRDEEALEVLSSLLDPAIEPNPIYDPPAFLVAARVLAHHGADPTPYRTAFGRTPVSPLTPLWSAAFAAELGERSWSEVERLDGPAWLGPHAALRDGERLLAAGDRVAARRRLTEALERAERLGAAGTATRARELLAAAGPGAVPARSAAPDALSPRERQVLDLIAEGLTNAQIAQRLFISQKTVSIHVSAVLRKLGVGSRTEAAVKALG